MCNIKLREFDGLAKRITQHASGIKDTGKSSVYFRLKKSALRYDNKALFMAEIISHSR